MNSTDTLAMVKGIVSPRYWDVLGQIHKLAVLVRCPLHLFLGAIEPVEASGLVLDVRTSREAMRGYCVSP